MRTIASKLLLVASLIALPALAQQQINLTSQVRGLLPLANGGIGIGTLTGLALGNGTSAFSAFGGTSCTNQFVRSLSAAGAATCNAVANTDLANSSTTVAGQTCTLGSSCSITFANLSSIPTTLSGYGITSPLPIAQGGTAASSAGGTAVDNISGFASTGFLTRTGAGAYSFQSTTNGITLGNMAQIGTNTVLGNSTSGTANASALSVGGCSSASSALIWTTNTGFGCNTSINAATLGGATFAAPGAIGGGTASAGSFTTGAFSGDIARTHAQGTESHWLNTTTGLAGIAWGFNDSGGIGAYGASNRNVYIASNNGYPIQTLISSSAITIVSSTGLAVIGTLSTTGLVSVGGSSPASGAACTTGTITWDSGYIYVCTASTVWKRAALTGSY